MAKIQNDKPVWFIGIWRFEFNISEYPDTRDSISNA